MNIKLIKEKWIKFYKRGFITGLMVLSFICLIDQVLQTPFFFNKINSDNFMLSLTLIISLIIDEEAELIDELRVDIAAERTPAINNPLIPIGNMVIK